MLNVKVSYHVLAGEWISQPLTGLQLLLKNDVIKLSVDIHQKRKIPHSQYLEIYFDNKRVLLDLHDGDLTADKYYRNYHLIFKRSIDPYVLNKRAEPNKFKLYGLNYFTTCMKNPYYNPKFFNLLNFFTSKAALFRLSKNLINKYSNILPIKRQTVDLLDYNYFEYYPVKKTNDVLFLTRLWFPYDTFNTEEKMQRAFLEHPTLKKTYDLDQLRISVIEYLNSQNNYKSVAGISSTSNLLPLHQNLVLPTTVTQRRHFIHLARESKICVTTTGLWDSIGWKFGEFINLGCAVLTECKVHLVSDGLLEGRNYFEFKGLEGFKNKINMLLKDAELLEIVSENNILYSNKHLKPDCLMLEILDEICKLDVIDN